MAASRIAIGAPDHIADVPGPATCSGRTIAEAVIHAAPAAHMRMIGEAEAARS